MIFVINLCSYRDAQDEGRGRPLVAVPAVRRILRILMPNPGASEGVALHDAPARLLSRCTSIAPLRRSHIAIDGKVRHSWHADFTTTNRKKSTKNVPSGNAMSVASPLTTDFTAE